MKILIFLFTFFLVTILFLFLLWLKQIYKYRNVKLRGPKPLPIVGNTLEFLAKRPVDTFKSLTKKHGEAFLLFLGPITTTIAISNPKLIQKILSSNVHLNKSAMYDFVKDFLKEGLGTTSKNRWKVSRKLFTPSFDIGMLNEFNEVFNEASNLLVSELKTTSGKDIQIEDQIYLTTLKVILETTMGVKFHENNQEHLNYINACDTFFEIVARRNFSFLKRSNVIFKFTKDFTLQQDTLHTLFTYTTKVINKKIKERQEFNESYNKSGDDTKKRRLAIIDVLLDLSDQNVMSLEEVRWDVDTFVFAGQETSSTTLVFLLQEICASNDIQKLVYEELMDITNGEIVSHFTIQQLNQMKYLECVIKEGLRKYTLVPLIERSLDEDVEMDGQIIPAGTNVTILTHMMHTNEKYYPEPDKFMPERFFPENSVDRHPFAFVPFSAGPRNCIGQRFAMLEMKTILAKLILNFKIIKSNPDHKMEVDANLFLRSLNGYSPMKFIKR